MQCKWYVCLVRVILLLSHCLKIVCESLEFCFELKLSTGDKGKHFRVSSYLKTTYKFVMAKVFANGLTAGRIDQIAHCIVIVLYECAVVRRLSS